MRTFGKYSITDKRYEVLEAVSDGQKYSINQIADRLNRGRGDVGNNVQNMISLGLLESEKKSERYKTKRGTDSVGDRLYVKISEGGKKDFETEKAKREMVNA